MVHFNDLPDTILIHILDFLTPNDVLPLELVSPRWNHCVARSLERVELMESLPSEFVMNLNRSTPNNTLRIGIFTQWPCLSYYHALPHLEELVLKCPRVQCLDLGNEVLIKDQFDLMSQCPELRIVSLDLSDSFDSNNHLPEKEWIRLVNQRAGQVEHFGLTIGPYFLYDHSIIRQLEKFFAAAGKLKQVGFFTNIIIDPFSILAALDQVNATTSIEVNFDQVDRQMPPGIVDVLARRVHQLTIRMNMFQSSFKNKRFNRLKDLKIIASEAHPRHLVVVQPVTFANLKHLCLVQFNATTSHVEAVVSAIGNIDQLESIELTDCNVDLDDIQSLLGPAHSLTKLVFDRILFLSLDDLIDFETSPPEMKFFKSTRRLRRFEWRNLHLNQHSSFIWFHLITNLIQLDSLESVGIQLHFEPDYPSCFVLDEVRSVIGAIGDFAVAREEVEARFSIKGQTKFELVKRTIDEVARAISYNDKCKCKLEGVNFFAW